MLASASWLLAMAWDKLHRSPWCLGGIGEWIIGIIGRDYYRDPFPHSLLSTRESFLSGDPCFLHENGVTHIVQMAIVHVALHSAHSRSSAVQCK